MAEEKKEQSKTLEVVAKTSIMTIGVGAIVSGIAFLQAKELLFGLVMVGVGIVLFVGYQLIKKYF